MWSRVRKKLPAIHFLTKATRCTMKNFRFPAMSNPNCDPNMPFGPPPPNSGNEDPGPPPVDKSNMICLHGPCQYLWTTRARFDASNNVEDMLPDGMAPLKISKMLCTRLLADPEPDVSEERIYECSEWDPVDLVQLAPREARRAAWSAKNGGVE